MIGFICRIQWQVQFFRFRSEMSFLANLVQDVKIVSFRLNVVASLIRICRIQ